MQYQKARWLLRIAARLGAAYALICVAVFAVQRSFLYFPSSRESTSDLDVWIEREDAVGYCREVPEPETVWLMLHGNAGQASDRSYVLGCVSPSDAFYVLEYPGYGAQPGTPSQKSFDRAAFRAYERLADKYPDTPLGVIGESIGSGPACSLAKASRPPDKIVLIVPFDTLASAASRRFFFLPVSLLLLDRWNNIESLKDYKGPVDIYCARDDKVIPCAHAHNLARHIPHANLQEIPGGHNDWRGQAAVNIMR